MSGSADRVFVFFGLSYEAQVWVYRGLVWIAPLIVFFIARAACRELQAAEQVERQRERTEAEAAPRPA